ncbi:MAG: gamma-glutamyl-gamma-aminobutyrate hydrolase family protein [Candidatus Limnocylindrales bacterium]
MPVRTRRPRILVTLADPRRAEDPSLARLKNTLYLDAVRRGGGEAVGLDETASPGELADETGAMEGLLLSGGADLDPALYGAVPRGSVGVQRHRDAIDHAAWKAATARGLPVLGICRGFQAINVFLGGSLVQHLEGHAGAGYPGGPTITHPFRLLPGSRLAQIAGGVGPPRDPEDPRTEPPAYPWAVNTYHHQGVRAEDLAPGLAASGFAPYDHGELVEALESTDGSWIVGVQFHPERTDSTPPEFDRLFAALAEAARLAR